VPRYNVSTGKGGTPRPPANYPVPAAAAALLRRAVPHEPAKDLRRGLPWSAGELHGTRNPRAIVSRLSPPVTNIRGLPAPGVQRDGVRRSVVGVGGLRASSARAGSHPPFVCQSQHGIFVLLPPCTVGERCPGVAVVPFWCRCAQHSQSARGEAQSKVASRCVFGGDWEAKHDYTSRDKRRRGALGALLDEQLPSRKTSPN
jgi:hypothetical protein